MKEGPTEFGSGCENEIEEREVKDAHNYGMMLPFIEIRRTVGRVELRRR